MRSTTDFSRAMVSTAVVAPVTLGLVLLLARLTDLDLDDVTRVGVSGFVVGWPLYVATYVWWSIRVYSRLDEAGLRRLANAEARDQRRWLNRALGMGSTTDTTTSAAVTAVVVTVVIAQRPEFRVSGIYIALALLVVASAWLLMVFSFAQGYLRLSAASDDGAHLRFRFPDPPRFSDYLTLAVLHSTMAATASAEITSRPAWVLVRLNVVVAFLFNSVIIALTVSLLFAGFLT